LSRAPNPAAPDAVTPLLAVSVVFAEILVTWFCVRYFTREHDPGASPR
jgi:hypothetical protein